MIDEAQRINNIGLIIKLLVDNFPEKQIIATGSSSFDLANTIVEPLTGRALFRYLYPLSIQETHPNRILTAIQLEQRLIYGSYPNVISPAYLPPLEYLKLLIDQYLYKDIIEFDGIKKSSTILKLLQALALQI
jgi:predicted AAA+ superfamily ATPase